MVNGVGTASDGTTFTVVNGKIQVGVRAVSENNGADVAWDDGTKTVTVTTTHAPDEKNNKSSNNVGVDFTQTSNNSPGATGTYYTSGDMVLARLTVERNSGKYYQFYCDQMDAGVNLISIGEHLVVNEYLHARDHGLIPTWYTMEEFVNDYGPLWQYEFEQTTVAERITDLITFGITVYLAVEGILAFTAMAAYYLELNGMLVNNISSESSAYLNLLRTNTINTGYRYVGRTEYNIIKQTGSIPNVDKYNNMKNVFVSPNKYYTVATAEEGLQIGKLNPMGASSSPLYRVEFDMRGIDFTYGGNVAGGTGIELITRQMIPVDLANIYLLY